MFPPGDVQRDMHRRGDMTTTVDATSLGAVFVKRFTHRDGRGCEKVVTPVWSTLVGVYQARHLVIV